MSVFSYTETGIDSQDERWDDWEEDEMNEKKVCLFCPESFSGIEDLFSHCKSTHSFDFIRICRENKFEFYDRVRIVNYVRKLSLELNANIPQELLVITGSEPFFKDDKYLKPIMDNDSLIFELDELDLSCSSEPTSSSGFIQYENGKMEHEDEQKADSNEIEMLKQKISQLTNSLSTVTRQFSDYKDFVKTQMYENLGISQNQEDEVEESQTDIKKLQEQKPFDYYFNSYAYNEIHMDMIKDSVRTDGYRDFIYNNKAYFKGKVVLDVGCGTGILSMFAARAGASKVFAVDNSEIIEKAKANVIENKLENVITLIKGKIEEINLPVNKVDIIISEWMGYFLLFESMLDSVLVARDRFLDPVSGVMGPHTSRIYITGVQDDEYMNDYVNFWDNVYGFSMTKMKEGLKKEAVVTVVPGNTVISSHEKLIDFNHYTCNVKDLDFVVPFCLKITKPGKLHAIVGYFDVLFSTNRQKSELDEISFKSVDDCLNGSFTTSLCSKATHWKQTMFLLDHPLDVENGDLVVGIFECKKSKANPREIDVIISYSLLNKDAMKNLEKSTIESLESNKMIGNQNDVFTKSFIEDTVFNRLGSKTQKFFVR
ncbi:hypothetical protein BB559_005322 [Furculomyces boomerangus]|uniref:type I protein arginine methyltransferase n=1 Tax=Furculomyces boomerangus TaxID=61424 RepID=A0A2T9Y9E5_9FUNG|nr:hypothetical protein BB559_005322 [Furculomyces boomerangus]